MMQGHQSMSKLQWFVFLAVVLTACGEDVAEVAVDDSARPVKLIQLAGTSSESTSRYPAVIGAGEEADLSFPVGGMIQEVPVSDADQVSEGDLIARLDTRDFESNVTSARASYENAEEEYQRAVRLAEQDAIAQNVLEQRKTQRDVVKAQLDSAQKGSGRCRTACSIFRCDSNGAC